MRGKKVAVELKTRVIGGLSVNLRFFRKSLNELGNTVLFRHFCTRVSMD